MVVIQKGDHITPEYFLLTEIENLSLQLALIVLVVSLIALHIRFEQ